MVAASHPTTIPYGRRQPTIFYAAFSSLIYFAAHGVAGSHVWLGCAVSRAGRFRGASLSSWSTDESSGFTDIDGRIGNIGQHTHLNQAVAKLISIHTRALGCPPEAFYATTELM